MNNIKRLQKENTKLEKQLTKENLLLISIFASIYLVRDMIVSIFKNKKLAEVINISVIDLVMAVSISIVSIALVTWIIKTSFNESGKTNNKKDIIVRGIVGASVALTIVATIFVIEKIANNHIFAFNTIKYVIGILIALIVRFLIGHFINLKYNKDK